MLRVARAPISHTVRRRNRPSASQTSDSEERGGSSSEEREAWEHSGGLVSTGSWTEGVADSELAKLLDDDRDAYLPQIENVRRELKPPSSESDVLDWDAEYAYVNSAFLQHEISEILEKALNLDEASSSPPSQEMTRAARDGFTHNGPAASVQARSRQRANRKTRMRNTFEMIKAKILNGTIKAIELENLSTRRSQDAVRIRREIFCQRLLKQAFTPYDARFDEGGKTDDGKDVARDLVKSLVKKMDKAGVLNEFAAIFDAEDKTNTPCFTIGKGLDGRIQVSTRKFQPHVCYPRLFRFPGLRSGRELQPLSHCQRPFSEKFDDYVCINPWHVDLLPASACARRTPTLPATPSQRPVKRSESPTPTFNQELAPQTPFPQPTLQPSTIPSNITFLQPSGASIDGGSGQMRHEPENSIARVLGDARAMEEIIFGDGIPPPQRTAGSALEMNMTADLADALELIDEDSKRVKETFEMHSSPRISTPPSGLAPGQKQTIGGAVSPYSDLPSLPSPTSHRPPHTPYQMFPPTPQYPGQYPAGHMGVPMHMMHHQPGHMGIPSVQPLPPPRMMCATPIGMRGPPVIPQMPHVHPSHHLMMGHRPPQVIFPKGRIRESTFLVVGGAAEGSESPGQPLSTADVTGPMSAPCLTPAVPTTSPEPEADVSARNIAQQIELPSPKMADTPGSEPPVRWVNINYYELAERISDVYRPSSNVFSIDGFTSTTEPDRYCLGAVSNPNRNPAVVTVRRQIGRGVRISRRDGMVTLTCLSDSPVFVQSPTHSHKAGDNISTVYRIATGHTLEIFSDSEFCKMLDEARAEGYKKVYNLQNVCSARISFVKGYGMEYRRQTIQAAPCWVELHFQQPLQVLDKELHVLENIQDRASSFT